MQHPRSLSRRDTLRRLAALAAVGGAFDGVTAGGRAGAPQIMTVQGPIPAGRLGVALPHEHVMSTFGEEPRYEPGYDEGLLLGQVVPILKGVKALGCRALFDCTAAYFGRDVRLLRKVSEQTGLHIVTNTGYYGAANDRYVPPHAFEETAEQLAGRWVKEWKEGIDGTGIRPGFVKLAVDAGPLSEIDAKLLRAGALTHLATGLTLAVHTANNPQAVKEQLTILKRTGVHPSAWVWVHAHQVALPEDVLDAAGQGAWISFDGVRVGEEGESGQPGTILKHLVLLKEMKKRGLLGQVLLSHDGNSFSAGKDTVRPCDALFTTLLPTLEADGFSRREIDGLVKNNPQEAFGIRVRKR